MAYPAWPVGLPNDVLGNGYEEHPPRVILRTPMDIGPAKIRRLISNDIRPISISMVLTLAQVATFDSFFMTDLFGGALRFTWTHPRTGAAIESRIMTDSNQGPRYTNLGGGKVKLDFVMEILP